MRALYQRLESLIHELAKFGVVGAVGFVIDVSISNLLFAGVHVGPLTSKAVSTFVAATFSYFANRHWTWSHRARRGVAREYWMFFALSLAGLAITEACIGFTHYVLGLHSVLAYNISGNVVGLGLGTLWRFWSFKRWVFLPIEPSPEQASDDAAASAAV